MKKIDEFNNNKIYLSFENTRILWISKINKKRNVHVQRMQRIKQSF
jgi:hypothetical protein